MCSATQIRNLKSFTQNSLPQCKIIISNIINRIDYGKASPILGNLKNNVSSLKLVIVDNKEQNR